MAVAPEAVVARVQGLAQFAWIGGDPGVDFPEVALQRQEGSDWVAVTTAAGRPITSNLHDMLMLWQPEPLYPIDEQQTHTWWVGWQPVGHVHDRAGLPEGSYRFLVTGQHYAGGATVWPWPTEDYTVVSEPFEVTVAAVSLTLDGDTLAAWIQAPEWGYRLIDEEGSARLSDSEEGMSGANPVRDGTLSWTLADGSTSIEVLEGTITSGVTIATVSVPEDAVSLTVSDGWGNTGTLEL